MDNASDQNTWGPGWDHLFVRDARAPEERVEAERRETRRRRGSGNKDWWKKYLDPSQEPAPGSDHAHHAS